MPTPTQTRVRTQARSPVAHLLIARLLITPRKSLLNNDVSTDRTISPKPPQRTQGLLGFWLAVSGCVVSGCVVSGCIVSSLLGLAQPTIAAIARPASNTTVKAANTVTDPSSDRPIQSTQRRLEREILTLGSQGETVRELQAILYLLGYYQGEVSGTFSPATAQAVRGFQVANRLQADGIVGSATWGMLLPLSLDATTPTSEEASATSTSTLTTSTPDQPRLQLGDDDLAVFLLQQRLSLRGYYRGAIDGHFGPVTQTAVINVQRDAGLPTTGVVDGATWSILLQD